MATDPSTPPAGEPTPAPAAATPAAPAAETTPAAEATATAAPAEKPAPAAARPAAARPAAPGRTAAAAARPAGRAAAPAAPPNQTPWIIGLVLTLLVAAVFLGGMLVVAGMMTLFAPPAPPIY